MYSVTLERLQLCFVSRLAVAGGHKQEVGGMWWSALGQKDRRSSGLAGGQPLYVSALNVNGLTLATHTAMLRETQDGF